MSNIIYPFTPQYFQLFKKKPGIYGIVCQNQIIYVGQSHDLEHRLKAHWKKEAKNYVLKKIEEEKGKINRTKQLALYTFIDAYREQIYFTILEETTNLDEREEYYITQYLPTFNYKGVNVPY